MADDVRALMREAESLVEERDWDVALDKFKKILELDPENADACQQMAHVFAVRGLVKSVVKTYFRLMDILEARSDMDLAIEVAGWIQRLQPESDTARMRVIQIHRKKGDLEEVVRRSRELARLYIELGQGDQSIALLQNAQEADPENLDIGLELAEMYVSYGHIEEGAGQYRKVAQAFQERGNVDKAAEAFRRMKVIVPDDPGVLFTLGKLYVGLGKYNEAEQEFRSILRHNLNHEEALLALGDVCQKKGQFRDAILAFNKILSINPQENTAKEKLGELYQAQGISAEAVKHYLSAAHAFQQLDETGRAIKLYQRVLALDPTNPTSCRELTNLGAPLTPDPGDFAPPAAPAPTPEPARGRRSAAAKAEPVEEEEESISVGRKRRKGLEMPEAAAAPGEGVRKGLVRREDGGQAGLSSKMAGKPGLGGATAGGDKPMLGRGGSGPRPGLMRPGLGGGGDKPMLGAKRTLRREEVVEEPLEEFVEEPVEELAQEPAAPVVEEEVAPVEFAEEPEAPAEYAEEPVQEPEAAEEAPLEEAWEEAPAEEAFVEEPLVEPELEPVAQPEPEYLEAPVEPEVEELSEVEAPPPPRAPVVSSAPIIEAAPGELQVPAPVLFLARAGLLPLIREQVAEAPDPEVLPWRPLADLDEDKVRQTRQQKVAEEQKTEQVEEEGRKTGPIASRFGGGGGLSFSGGSLLQGAKASGRGGRRGAAKEEESAAPAAAAAAKTPGGRAPSAAGSLAERIARMRAEKEALEKEQATAEAPPAPPAPGKIRPAAAAETPTAPAGKGRRALLTAPPPPPPPAEEMLAGPAPAEEEMLAGPAPAGEDMLAGPAPAEEEMLAGPAPAEEDMLAGPAPTEEEMLAGAPPEEEEMLAGAPPTEEEELYAGGAFEEPAFEDQPEAPAEQVLEEPLVEEQPEVAEEPLVEEQPEVAEEPLIEEQPEVAEEPLVEEQPVVAEEPLVEEQPEVAEEPLVEEQPEVAEEPLVEVQPEVSEQSLVEEQPEVAEEPLVEEQPPVAEELHLEEPGPVTAAEAPAEVEAEVSGSEEPEAPRPVPEPVAPAPEPQPVEVLSSLKVESEFSEAMVQEARRMREKLAGADVTTAIGAYRRAVEESPDNLVLRTDLADIHLRYGLLDDAVMQYRQILMRKPESVALRHRLADAHLWNAEYEEAASTFLELAELHIRKGHEADALDILQTVLSLDPHHFVARRRLVDRFTALDQRNLAAHHLRQLAETALARGNVQEAIGAFKQLMTLSDDATFQERLALVYETQGSVPDALENYRALAHRYRQAGQWDEATVATEKLVGLDADNLDDRRALIELYERLGRHEQVLTGQFELACRHRALGAVPEAIALFEQVLGKDPAHYEARRRLVDCYLETGNLAAALEQAQPLTARYLDNRETAPAIDLYRRLTEADPKSVELRERLLKFYEMAERREDVLEQLLVLADLHEEAERYREAVQILQRAIEVAPGRDDLHYRLARLYDDRLGSVPGALNELRRVHELNPGHPDAMDRYARMLMDQRKASEAAKVLLDLFEADSINGGISREKLLREYKDRIEADVTDWPTRFVYGELCFHLNRIEDAVEQFQKTRTDRDHELRSYNMLGLAFAKNPRFGLDMAVRQFRRGLETKGHAEQDYLDLRYNLAMLLYQNNRLQEALTELKDILAVDVAYRDVDEWVKLIQEEIAGGGSGKITRLPRRGA